MIEPKISLSLLVQGADMLSSQWCEKNPKEGYDLNKVVIETTKGKGKKAKKIKEVLNVFTRKSTLVTQNISISEEAYNSMITTSPFGIPTKVWKKMNINEKLKAHFDLIAHDLHAVSYTYEILKD